MTEIMEVVTALTALTAVTAGDKLPASPLPSSAAGKCLLRLLFALCLLFLILRIRVESRELIRLLLISAFMFRCLLMT